MDKGSDEVRANNLKTKLPQSYWNFSDKNAAEIQREIRSTRAELDETVHAIQNRLAPQQFINNVSDMVRDVVRQGSPKIMETVRNNPLPSSLVVLGLGWLFIRGSAGPRRRLGRGYGRYDTEPEEYGMMGGEQVSSIEATDLSGSVESKYEHGKQKASDATRRMKEKAGQWTGQVKDKASQLSDQAREKTGQWTEQAKDKASQWTGQAREKASHLASQTRDRAGQMASDVMHKAGDVASHMAEATREKAGQFAEATMETASHLVGATRSKAGNLAHSTVEMTGNVAHRAGEQARNLGAATQNQIRRAGTGTYHLFQENPGAFALLCLGVGAALAMGLPATRKERELMGGQSEAFKQKAVETGQQALGKVEEIVTAGQEAMKDEARRQDVI